MYVSLSADLDISVNVRWTVGTYLLRTYACRYCLWTWCVSNFKSKLCNNKCRVDDDGRNEDKEEKLVFYILFDCSPSDERARTMTMYYLPSPEFVVPARDGISSSAFAAPHPAAMVEKCFWQLILLVFCA
jgi:hypothetical protein